MRISHSSHHPPKFGGRRPCESLNITLLVCHVTSHDHMMKMSCDLADGQLPPFVIILQRLLTIDFVKM